MTKTMGQTVYDIFGPNIGHSAARAKSLRWEYALTDEYMKNLSGKRNRTQKWLVCILKTTKGLRKEYLEYANQYRKGEREKKNLD